MTRPVLPPANLSKPAAIASWIAQLIAAFIIGQTLFFKLTGAPETIALFHAVAGEGTGDAMRYATALLEFAAVVLLLIPRTAVLGGLVAAFAMLGAIGAHVTKLGISIDPEALGKPDLEPLAGPSLFGMAVVALLSGLTVTALRRTALPFFPSPANDETVAAEAPEAT